MYEMDESKLLIPVLPWGAAEQMRGFRESLLMGFFMNRTVCVPPFWRERSPSAFKVAISNLTSSRIFRWLARGFQVAPESTSTSFPSLSMFAASKKSSPNAGRFLLIFLIKISHISESG
jgi:hypothetical protein